MFLGLRLLRRNALALTLALLSMFLALPLGAQRVFAGNGTAALPSFAFGLDPNTGLYRFGSDTLGVSAAGSAVARFSSVGLWASGVMIPSTSSLDFRNGSTLTSRIGVAGTDSIVFYDDGATPGLTFGMAGGVSTIHGGAGNMTIQAGTGNSRTLSLRGTNSAGTVINNHLVLNADSSVQVGQNLYATRLGVGIAPSLNRGLEFGGTTTAASARGWIILNNQTIASGAAGDSLFGYSGIHSYTRNQNNLVLTGLLVRPQYSGAGTVDTEYGLRVVGANFVGTSKFGVHVTGVSSHLDSIRVSNGTAAAPSIVLAISPTTGLYRVGADTLGIATGGVASLGIRGGASPTIFGGAGNMTIQAGTGNSRNMLLQATNGSGTATTAITAKFDTVRVHDEVVLAAITASSGTPNAVCIDATSKQLTENAASSCVVSSARFKRNIVDLTTPTASRIVSQLRPRAFTYRQGGRQAIGLIAEEADTVDHRLATRNSNGQINSVNYEQVTIALLKVVQDQQRRLDALCKSGLRAAC